MLTRLSLSGFRNLATAEWLPSRRFELLLGDNGAGKTSFIEAVYVLATTRSFRTPHLSECGVRDGEGFALAGEVAGTRRTDLGIALAGGVVRRSVNSSPSTLAEHLVVLPVISWTTASSQIFTGAPAERRRLLDQGIVAVRPQALSDLATYRQALGQKRKLLAGAPGELQPWNEVLAPAAVAVVEARQRFVDKLARAFAQIVERESLPYRGFEMKYRPSPPEALEGSAAMERVLADKRRSERQLKRPLLGPHLDELTFRWQGRDLRRMVSAGERKGIALALTAARGEALMERARAPLFLLDDVDAELDSKHLKVALRAFSRARQIFATSSRPEVWRGIEEVATSTVEGGSLTSS